MDDYHAEYKLCIEEGWTHEDVCKNSYTDDRLSWLFNHSKGAASGVVAISNDCGQAVKVIWFTVSGQKLDASPIQKGVYIKTTIYANGRSSSEKCYIN